MRENVLTILTWDEVREILDTCEALSCEFNAPTYKGEEYCREVLSRLRKKNDAIPPIDERYQQVLSAAQTATGRILANTRSRSDTLIRMFVAHRLHEEGYSFSRIGRMMHRDHSTAVHLCKTMNEMLSVSYAYKEEMEMYERFCELC